MKARPHTHVDESLSQLRHLLQRVLLPVRVVLLYLLEVVLRREPLEARPREQSSAAW